MREIKFRTWFPKSNVMSMPYTLDDAMKHKVDFLHKDEIHLQYTGLLDKNGVEIYEGDIVNSWSQGSKATLEVKWGVGTAGFFLYRKHGAIIWHLSGGGKDYIQETVEVIGNIYENPKLLEQQ